MIAGIIFDCDGVLVDSEETSCRATADLLTKVGFPMTLAEVKTLFLGRSISAVYAHYQQATGRALHASFGDEKEALFAERARGALKTMPGVLEVVRALHRKRVPIAVATSGSPGKVAFSLAETGLAQYFSVVCTSLDVPRGKPFPDLFLHTAKALGVEVTQCAVIEDSIPGIEAGVAARMLTIGYPSSHNTGALLDAGAMTVVDHLGALLRIPALAHLA